MEQGFRSIRNQPTALLVSSVINARIAVPGDYTNAEVLKITIIWLSLSMFT